MVVHSATPARRVSYPEDRTIATRYLTVHHARPAAGVEVCAPVGEIDAFTVTLLQDVLAETERRRVPRVVVDASRVGFLAVAGVRVLLDAAESARAAGRCLELTAPTRPVWRALKITGACHDSGIVVSYETVVPTAVAKDLEPVVDR